MNAIYRERTKETKSQERKKKINKETECTKKIKEEARVKERKMKKEFTQIHTILCFLGYLLALPETCLKKYCVYSYKLRKVSFLKML